jgi:hypothetical protein
MIVKPPVSESWPQKDRIDTIDFLPTIARLAGASIPESCQGIPIQKTGDSDPRITERIYPDWYSVSVEIDNVKGILTYKSDYPNRPSEDISRKNTKIEEFYSLDAVRSTQAEEQHEISPEKKNIIRKMAKSHMENIISPYNQQTQAMRPSQETIDRLEKLGYK